MFNEFKLVVEIKAPEIVQAMIRLAEAMARGAQGVVGAPIKDTGVGKAVVSPVVPVVLDQGATSADPTTAGVVYTLEQVRRELGALAKARGKDVARGVLASFQASQLTELPHDQYAAAMSKIKELI